MTSCTCQAYSRYCGIRDKVAETYAAILFGDNGGIKDWKTLNLDEPRPTRELQPVEKLFLAILMDAIATLVRGPTDVQNKRVWAWSSTERWLNSEDRDYVFGFVAICEQFDWNPTWVRKQIAAHIRKAQQEKPKQKERHAAQVRRYGHRLGDRLHRKTP